MSLPSFTIRYKVLKPHPTIALLAKSFRPLRENGYELAQTADRSVRKYRGWGQSIEAVLQAAEWRLSGGQQIVRCFFVELLKPTRERRGVEYEVWVEHMEVGLDGLAKLIAPESLYLLLEATKGYQVLFSKFKRASVGGKTVGLNKMGKCVVWHSQDLCALYPSSNGLTSEVEIILGIIEEIASRSQPLCQGLLSRMADQVRRKQLTLSGFIEYVSDLAESMKMGLPADLRYLVNQHKILLDVRNIKERTQMQEVNQRNRANLESRTQRYRPVKTQTRQNVFAETRLPKTYVKRDHRMSQVNILQGTRVASSFQSKKFLTEKNIARKKESYLSTNMSSFIANSDRKWTIRNHSKCTEQGEDSNKRIFSKSKERTVISKCKSSQGRKQSDISVIYARPFDRLIFSEKDPADHLSQEKPYAFEGHNSQFSQRATSFRQKQQARTENSKVYKSFVIDFGHRIVEKNTKCIGQECQEHESSPNKEKSNDNSSNEDCVNRSSGSIQGEPKAEQLLKANQWIKNLDSHQLWVQSKLNTSITLGQQKSTYLDDVKLEKLEMLSRQMAMSRLPDEIYQPLYSQTIIE